LSVAGTLAAVTIKTRPVGSVVVCDLPKRPGTTTPTGCTPWRQGSWARPSNRPQATPGCGPCVLARRPSRWPVDKFRDGSWWVPWPWEGWARCRLPG